MTEQLLVITPAELDKLCRDMAEIKAALAMVTMEKKPEWVSVEEYARQSGKSRATINRYIEAGKLEIKTGCGPLLVKAFR